MTLTAMRWCSPASNDSDTVPENAANRCASTTGLRARASFCQAVLSGKEAWVMQNVRPSQSLSRNQAATLLASVAWLVFVTGS